jgi:hypothetical protein
MDRPSWWRTTPGECVLVGEAPGRLVEVLKTGGTIEELSEASGLPGLASAAESTRADEDAA